MYVCIYTYTHTHIHKRALAHKICEMVQGVSVEMGVYDCQSSLTTHNIPAVR